MTPAQAAFWRRVMARARAQQPAIAAELLRFLERVRQALPPDAVMAFIAANDVDGLLARMLSDVTFDANANELQTVLFNTTAESVKYFAQSIPLAGAARIRFDLFNPRMVDAIRALNTKVMQQLKTDARETVRAYVENGLRDGVNPRVIGRQLRSVVGLGPTQLQEAANFRQALVDRDIDKALGYARRDPRFDKKLMSGTYTDADIEQWATRYVERRVAWNAETIARTSALDALKQGDRLAWEGSIKQGLVDRGRVMKQWLGTLDSRERPAHVAMEKQVVPFDFAFSNGERTPGESTYNCRCLMRIFVAK